MVPVEIDGYGAAAFLLDTGSTRTAISATLARRLGARPVGDTLVVTPAGSVRRPLTPLLGIVVGPSRPMAALAMIVPDADLARAGRTDGILGQDLLARLTVTIDYAQGRLLWSVADVPIDAITLRMDIDAGRLVVRLPRPSCEGDRDDCRPLQLIPDTGADGIVLFRAPGARLPFITPLDTAAVRTLAGTRVVRRGLIDAVDLDVVRLHGQVASIVELPSSQAPTADGLLPLKLFARVVLDGPGRRLSLIPR